MKRLFGACVAMALLAGQAAAVTFNERFSGYFALGDSLSDPGNLYAATGNTRPAAPYVDGRFSNGPVFTEYLGSGFEPGEVRNFAYGGATAARAGAGAPPLPLNLDDQLALFQKAASGGAAKGSLVTLLFGANDIFRALDTVVATAPANPIPQLFGTALTAAASLGSAVGKISTSEPARIVVLNLPDLGATPAYSGTALAPLASFATSAFNSALASLPAFSTSSTDVSVFDFNGLFASFQADPAAFGFDPAVAGTPCFPAGAGPDCEGFVFADPVHPTTQAHAVLAERVAGSLGAEIPAPVPLPAGLPLLAAGLGLILVVRKRRRN